MNRAEKTALVESMHKSFTDSGSIIVLGFQGINVPDITELRQKIRDTDGNYEVVKNTLAILAADGTLVDDLKEQFTGPTAIACTSGVSGSRFTQSVRSCLPGNRVPSPMTRSRFS